MQRTVEIFPSYSDIETQGKIKALLVIDNSATMYNSQQNLGRNIQALLSEIKKYDAEVKVITTTTHDPSCTLQNPNCASRPNLLYSRTVTSKMVDGFSGTSTSESYSENSEANVFRIDKNWTDNQKQITLNQIQSYIQNIGTSGSDQEAPMAALAYQLHSNSFFKKGDRALIYVLTDEDDSSSTSKITTPMGLYNEVGIENKSEPGFLVMYSGFRSNAATCQTKNEIGQTIGTYFLSSSVHISSQACDDFVKSQKANCSFALPACSAAVDSLGPIALNGRPQEQACAEAKAEFSIYKPTHCTYNITKLTSISHVAVNKKSYIFGWDENLVNSMNSYPQSMRDIIIPEIKKRLSSLFGSKFLIAVSTNTKNQSCSLNTGQSFDRFFSQITPEFSSLNYNISSICDFTSSANTTLRQIASNFERVVTDEYLLTQASSERLIFIKAHINGQVLTLTNEVDYSLRNSSLVLLKPELKKFTKLEILFQKNQ